jgi:peptidoglycan/LPS O-acetylase OafA/YrhL
LSRLCWSSRITIFRLEPGYAGVSFFFVLSGFILAFNYAPRVADRGDFWFRRFARIWPTHALTFVIAIPIGLDTTNFVGSAATAVLNLALLQSWMPQPEIYFSFNRLSWSISNEAFYYALFPVLLARLAGVRAATRWSIVGTWTVLLVAAAAAWFAAFGHVNPLAGRRTMSGTSTRPSDCSSLCSAWRSRSTSSRGTVDRWACCKRSARWVLPRPV